MVNAKGFYLLLYSIALTSVLLLPVKKINFLGPNTQIQEFQLVEENSQHF